MIWGCRSNNTGGIVLHNFVNTKNFYVLHLALPISHLPLQKKTDILDIFINKISSNLHCLTKNISDLNSDHSSVALNVSATVHERIKPHRLFSSLTDHLEFQNILNQ